MIVSWQWLKQYVALEVTAEELARRLTMAGLNHEGTRQIGDDLAIELEVTSNRPDCLCHLGVAREAAALFDLPLRVPPAQPKEGRTPVQSLIKVRIDCPDLCWRYSARVIRGVKVGPSPQWLVRRLQTLGLTPVNNVVDISNYVLMECGQPLHTFDYGKLKGPEIIVRRPRPGETIEAIDHKLYELDQQMCVIADAEDPVAIAGVMGGAATEISTATRDVLIESAGFNPLSIRTTSRKLGLQSDSSYRFERGIDPEGIDWASRRCAELILEIAGGELAAGAVDVGESSPQRTPITLRYEQIKRILGIDVPPQTVRRILLALGCQEQPAALQLSADGSAAAQPAVERPGPQGAAAAQSRAAEPAASRAPGAAAPPPAAAGTSACSQQHDSITVIAPSWRRDLLREIDLIEEVARIEGYDKIPDDVPIPIAPSARSRQDRVLAKLRQVLAAAGIDEAITVSVVDEASSAAFSPWSDQPPLRTLLPVLRGCQALRRSLTPSLLQARQFNQALGNTEADLYEIARVYLPEGQGLPREELMLAVVSGRDFLAVKGVVEAVLEVLRLPAAATAETCSVAMLDPLQSCCMMYCGAPVAYIGTITAEATEEFKLRGRTTVAEVRLAPLVRDANLTPTYTPLSQYPAIVRDLNFVVDEQVRWADVAATVRQACGPYLEWLEYRDTYRDASKLGEGKKSLLFSISLRWAEGTMTNQQADQLREQIVAACAARHGAQLRQ